MVFPQAFFSGKPTSRELTSQVPYLEHYVGEPYVSPQIRSVLVM